LLCFHGTPRSYDEIIKATTPDRTLDEVFAGVEADVLVGGHTHAQLFRRWQRALLLNPGSVGLPFDGVPPDSGPFPGLHNPAWAEYILLTVDGPRLSVDLRRVPYALDELRRAILACGMPHAEWFASDWVEE
jgi:predicted phosphodiesterase